jgi:hypothetical protein
MAKVNTVSDDAVTPPLEGGEISPCRKRNGELFRYLLTTFQALLPPEKVESFKRLALELDPAVAANCQTCWQNHPTDGEKAAQDPRRSRFLLRLVVSRVAPLCLGKTAIMPRSLIEGLDRYLIKAFGQAMYEESNAEANQMLSTLNIDDDIQMWAGIRKNVQWRRFVDTIFVRILFRFENFTLGKKTFINIVNMTMEDQSRFTFDDEKFSAVFEALFIDLWKDLQNEEQRIRWDFLFGDGAAKRLDAILNQGLSRWLKHKDNKVLASGRVVVEKAAKSRQKK